MIPISSVIIGHRKYDE